MPKSKGKCKICGKTLTAGSEDTPMDIAAEGVMEGIQEHIFQEHCDGDFNLTESEYSSIGDAWKYV